ncbi:MAG: hypothetical protein SFW36_13990, partial [Leptolyngbyaceae cyanobacterium bins.59]|nr:hypothetical protein [Leptolyngbyaceae cyanobacterium bins.59]
MTTIVHNSALPEVQKLLRRIEERAIDSEHQPITLDEVPTVANLLIQQWMENPLFEEMLEECL